MKKILSVITLLLFGTILSVAQEGSKLLPSVAYEKIQMEFLLKYQAFLNVKTDDPKHIFDEEGEQKKLALEYLDNVQMSELNAEEELALANIYIMAKKFAEALPVLKKIDKGSSEFAYSVSVAHMHALYSVGDFTTLEKAIADHWERFTPTPATKEMAWDAVRALARHYALEGKHDKAVELVMAEIGRIPEMPDATYYSALLFGDSIESFIAVGKRAELVALLEKHSGKFAALYDERKVDMPKGNSREDRQIQREIRQISTMAQRLRAMITQARLIGIPAPEINFARTYNADGLTWEKLENKVVIVDFWANWCVPCKKSFPTMRKIYDDYKDKGLVILGVTDLQGRFIDGSVKEAKVEPEREFELTEELIKRHEMTWPIIFSDQSKYNPEYGVIGIPTMVIIDRSGNIHKIEVGFNPAKEMELRKTIESLLEE